MICRFKGDSFGAVEGINPHAMGDGQHLAEAAGAQLLNMDVTYGPELRFTPASQKPFQQWLPASGIAGWFMGAVARRLPGWVMRKMIKRLLVTWQHPENALFDDGAILLNAEGRRFVDETVWPDRELAVARQPGKIAFLLLDAELSQRYSAWPHFISTAPDIAYAYAQDYLRLRPDVAVRCKSEQEIAARFTSLSQRAGIGVCAIPSAIEQTLADLRAGHRMPLTAAPWLLLGPVKAYFTTTEGGAAIHRNCQVLDTAGNVIEGLYAVGQTGLGGMVLWGHGLHIAWAMTSGRLAGKHAMAHA
jgi:fumarate reductase flavoprotein subunit